MVLVFCFQANAQTYIPTQAIFEDEIEVDWTTAGSPYILGIEDDLDPDETEFTIGFNDELVIKAEVEIQLAEGVVLFVDGIITVGDALTPSLETTFMPYDNERWDSIVLRGNGGNQGVGTFYSTTIYGGGAENGNGGLIVLTNWSENDEAAPENPSTTKPILFMKGNTTLDYSLYDSESSGIAIIDANPIGENEVDDNNRVQSTIEIVDMVIGNQNSQIEEHGIIYHRLADEGEESVLSLERVHIEECLQRGIYHELCRALTDNPQWVGNDGFDLDINDCEINNNGWDGFYFECPFIEDDEIIAVEVDVDFLIEDSEFNDNGSLQTGWGFKVNELPATGRAPATESNIVATGCSFDNNTQGGFCLWHTSFRETHIDDCTFNNNGEDVEEDNVVAPPNYTEGQGALIYIRAPNCEGVDFRDIRFINSEVKFNGLSGLGLRCHYYSERRGFWFIQGNEFNDNGQNIVWNDDDNDLMEGANIHAYQDVTFPTISNNILNGAYCGIYIEELVDEHPVDLVDHHHCPTSIKVYNNIQNLGTSFETGCQYGIVIEELSENSVDAVYNNVLWNNVVAGILIETPNLTGLGFEAPNQLAFNIIGADVQDDDLIGIQYTGGGAAPAYHFNGFWNNDENIVGAQAFDGDEDVEADPEFVNVATNDFHLQWSSPMINNDDNEDIPEEDPFENTTFDAIMTLEDFNDLVIDEEGFDVNRDVDPFDNTFGSINDIGCYGGYYANGTINHFDAEGIEPENQDFGWDPYCVIDADCDVLGEDGNIILRNDYYKAFDDYEIPVGEGFTIEAGTFIENDEDVQFDVRGQLNAEGTLLGPVYCTNLEGSEWVGIKVHSTASWQSGFEYCHVSYALTGLNLFGVADGANRIEVENCIVMNCSLMGIRIYGTRVHIHGDEGEGQFENDAWAPDEENHGEDLEDWLAEDDVQRWNTIRQIRGGSTSQGIYIHSEDDVIIENTKIYLCGNENDEDGFNQTGIYLFGSDVSMEDVTLLQNGNTGMHVVWAVPELNINEDPETSTDFKDNGLTVNDTESGNGAELLAEFCSGTDIEADYCDFDDVTNGIANSYSVWVDGSSGVNADNCHWGVGTAAFAAAEDDFINDQADIIHTNALNAVSDDDYTVDDLSLFEQARLLKNSGQYHDAINLFERIVSEDPNSSEAANSIRYIFACYASGNLDMDELREYYTDLVEEYEDTQLCNSAELLRAKTYIEERQFEEAQSQFDDLAENGRDPIQRGLAQIHSLELYVVINSNQIDAVTENEIAGKVEDILQQMRELASGGTEVNIPDEFALTHAYPNPFNSTVTIGYALNEDLDVKLSIFDPTGRLVAILNEGKMKAGYHNITWNANDATSGVYLCRLESEKQHRTIKLTLIK